MQNMQQPQSDNGFQIIDVDEGELLKRIQYTCVGFFSFYIGDELDLAVPEFHEEIWRELLNMVQTLNQPGIQTALRKLFAVPRGHAKSTLAKLAVVLLLKYTPLSFVLYVSKTSPMAKNAIRDILWWLESENERRLFGAMVKLKSSETEALWIVEIGTRNSEDMVVRRKVCTFRALGTESHVRGTLIRNKRPQILVIDDIEDLDNTTMPILQPKLDEWVMGSLLKALDAKLSVVLWLGNMIRKTTLLARHSIDAEWNPTVFGAVVRDKSTQELRALWEEKFSLVSLLKEYRAYRRIGTGHIWEAEMMNLTQDDIIQSDFSKAVIPPTPIAEMLEAGFLCLDPAFGKNSWNDDSAITVHARVDGLGIPVVIDSRYGRWSEEELFDEMIDMSYTWGLTTWCIEAVAAQKLLIPYFELMLKDREINGDMFTFLPLTGGKEAKSSRINAFRSIVAGGSYGVCDGAEDLLFKLQEYVADSTEHDDLCDSAAYGPIAWSKYGETIKYKGVQQNLMFMASAAAMAEGAGMVTLEEDVASC